MIIYTNPGKDLLTFIVICILFLGTILLPVLPITIACLIFAILIVRNWNKSSKEKDKIVSKLVKYKKFMVATNQYTIPAIAEEFDETAEEVEEFIQNAIDEGILRNVYLSKKTKEILLIHKKPAFNKAKVNQQNVSVENNVIINDNTTDRK